MMREKHSVQWIGLRENLSRKPWFLALHNGVSCRSSLNPYWNMLIIMFFGGNLNNYMVSASRSIFKRRVFCFFGGAAYVETSSPTI